MKSLSLSRLFSITVMGFALGMVSATLEPALLGYKILELMPANRNTILGFTTFVGLLVASLTQPLMGALSDRTQSRWGRRLPYLASGTLGIIVGLIWIATAPTFTLLLIGVVFWQFSSNTVQGPWQAIIPDTAPIHQRGLASALKLLCEGLAAVTGRLIAGQLIGLVPTWGSAAAIGATITAPALCLILGVIITSRGIRWTASEESRAPRRSIQKTLAHGFSVDLRTYPAFAWWFLNRLFFWGAMIAVSIFLLFYLIDVVGVTHAEAQRFSGQASAILGVALLVFAIPAKQLIERVSLKKLVFASGLIACAGTICILMTREYIALMMGGALIGAGVGVYMVASWALITAIVPPSEAARYLGIANMATAIGSASARLLGGTLIDAVNAASRSASLGYVTVYAIAATLFFLSAFAVLPLGLYRPRDFLAQGRSFDQ